MERFCYSQSKSFLIKRRFSNLLALSLLLLAMACSKKVDDSVKPSIRSDAGARLTNSGTTGINILLKTPVTDALLADLSKYGPVTDVLKEIKAVVIRAPKSSLSSIQQLAYVAAANPDVERQGTPIDAVAATDFTSGLNTWNLDAINVTDLGAGRVIDADATGVYIGVLDTGLLDSWRQYFPQERIAAQYAKSFGGGGGENGNVSEQPNKWEHDQNSHGTHVTSTIIGFSVNGTAVNGVAPKATIIPVKVLNQNGSGWSSVIAKGIVYMAELKAGALKHSPVVINMSLGGAGLDAIEKASIDYAIAKGVIIVASAGNSGSAGMGYPGAYAPVISVASAGWKKEFSTPTWWFAANVPDPTDAREFFISAFSSRQLAGQDLDVTAPGSNVVGPYQVNSGQTSYYYLSGTSMASPHVAGIVGLLAQKRPSLTAAEAETILENKAIVLPGYTAADYGAGFITADKALQGL